MNSQKANKEKMTITKAFSFPKSEALKKLFEDDKNIDQFNPTNHEMYIEKSANPQFGPIPTLYLNKDGGVGITLGHEKVYDKNSVPFIARLLLRTDFKSKSKFSPSKHTIASKMYGLPVKETYLTTIQDPIKIMHAKTDQEVDDILGEEGTTETTINTFGPISPEMVEQMLKDKCVTAIDMLKSVLKVMRIGKVTRDDRGKKGKISTAAQELTKFLLLAVKINMTSDDEESPFNAKLLDEFGCDCEQVADSWTKELLQKVKTDILQKIITTKEPCKPFKTDVETRIPRKKMVQDSTEDSGLIINIYKDEILKKPIDEEQDSLADTSEQQEKQEQVEKQNLTIHSDNISAVSEVNATASQSDVNQSMISVLANIKDELLKNGSSSNSSQGYTAWPENSKLALLAMSSEDPQVPALVPNESLVRYCSLSSGIRIAQQISSEHTRRDWSVDPTLCSQIKKGNLNTNTVITAKGPVEGPSPFSCGPMNSGNSKESHNTLLSKLELGTGLKTLSDEEISILSNQRKFSPTNWDDIMTVCENYKCLIKILTSDKSHWYSQASYLLEALRDVRQETKSQIDEHGISFGFSFSVRLHLIGAIFIRKALRNRQSLKKQDLNFEEIINSIEDFTFMNKYGIKFSVLKREPFGLSQDPSATNNHSGSQSNPNNGGDQSNSRGRSKRGNPYENENKPKRIKVLNSNKGTQVSTKFKKLAKAAKILPTNQCPKINGNDICMGWFYRGWCHDTCPRKATHVKASDSVENELASYVGKLQSKAREHDAAEGVSQCTSEQRLIHTKGIAPSVSTTKSAVAQIKENQPTSRKKISRESKLISRLRKICSTTYPPNNRPLFQFQNTMEAAIHNTNVLKKFNGNMKEAINAKNNTILHPGSEFRPLKELETIFKYHKNWSKFIGVRELGVKYGFDKSINYDDETKRKDIIGAIKKGNNNSTKSPAVQKIIQKNYNEEVESAWMIPIQKDYLLHLKGAGVIPIGAAYQMTMNDRGERIPKWRTTHDLSRPMLSGHSVNSMIDKELMEECLFGHCLLRMMHRIHDMRRRHPRKEIFLSKGDLKAAFRRLHVYIDHALLQMTILGSLAYFLGRVPFGVNEGPGKHDIHSNMLVDLSQALMDDKTWNPKTLHSPHEKLIPSPTFSDTDEPFGEAHALMVSFEKQMDIYCDGYIDDLMSCNVHTKDLSERARNAVMLAIHTMFRPVNEQDPIKRKDVLSMTKLLAEGTQEESKTILGWIINTRAFTISLTEDKAAAWQQDLDNLIAKAMQNVAATSKEIESIIGKLNTASYIFRDGRFFLSRIRWLHKVSKMNRGVAKVTTKIVLDLKLWKKFLTRLSTVGRSINHTTFTLPKCFLKQDASIDGLGGFTCLGLGWRYIIPESLRRLIHINVLEFMAIVVTTWLMILVYDIKEGNGIKILAQTDNTSALGWMKGSTRFDKNNKSSTTLREIIGRKLATLMLEADLSHYSQHIEGASNDIADQLSRDPHFTNKQCLEKISQQWGSSAPENLRIVELPSIILDWIQSIMVKAIQMEELPSNQRTSMLQACANGRSSQPIVTQAFSSEHQANKNGFNSLVGSRTASDITTLARRLKMNLEDERFAVNSTLYQRPSGDMDMTTLSEMEMEI